MNETFQTGADPCSGCSKITVLLADDHPVVRQGLRAVLSSESNIEVLAEAGDGPEAINLVEQLRPDVLIADLIMPTSGGLEVARQVSRRFPPTRVIILSMYSDEGYVVEAWRAGAAGYVAKEASSDDLVRAIHEVMAGRRYLNWPLSEQGLESYSKKAAQATTEPHATLTQREREVLHLLAAGLTSAEIADRLVISRRTAEAHRSHVMHKLSVRSQTELIRYALRHRILPEDWSQRMP